MLQVCHLCFLLISSISCGFRDKLDCFRAGAGGSPSRLVSCCTWQSPLLENIFICSLLYKNILKSKFIVYVLFQHFNNLFLTIFCLQHIIYKYQEKKFCYIFQMLFMLPRKQKTRTLHLKQIYRIQYLNYSRMNQLKVPYRFSLHCFNDTINILKIWMRKIV